MIISLDTNEYSELLRGDVKVLEWLEKAEKIFISVAVVAELLYGFKGGKKEKENICTLEEFLSNPKINVIEISLRTASIFSDIMHFLKQKGTPIPLNDIWIAAQSFEYDATLVTYDKHFQLIPKIKLWDFNQTIK